MFGRLPCEAVIATADSEFEGEMVWSEANSEEVEGSLSEDEVPEGERLGREESSVGKSSEE